MNAQPNTEAVRNADESFFEALLDRDIPALEALLGDEFLIVDVASGTVHSRDAFLEAIRAGAVTFEEIETFPDESVIRPCRFGHRHRDRPHRDVLPRPRRRTHGGQQPLHPRISG